MRRYIVHKTGAGCSFMSLGFSVAYEGRMLWMVESSEDSVLRGSSVGDGLSATVLSVEVWALLNAASDLQL